MSMYAFDSRTDSAHFIYRHLVALHDLKPTRYICYRSVHMAVFYTLNRALPAIPTMPSLNAKRHSKKQNKRKAENGVCIVA